MDKKKGGFSNEKIKSVLMKGRYMRKELKFLAIAILFCFIAGCASMGATNTTATNVGVASYESTGVILAQAFNTEKALLKAGTITADQDRDFQLGVYTKAVTCYKAIGAAAVTVLTVTDASGKSTAQSKFDSLNAELPALVAAVTTFISGVTK
jgi:hypothetical protein